MSRTFRVRGLQAVGLTMALAFAASAQPGRTPDVPSGDGAIRGRVVQADDGTPLAGVEVALYALSAGGLPGMRQTTSDAQGRFAFEGIARSGDLAYLLGARHQDVPFRGERIKFAAGETEQQVEIKITRISDDTSTLAAGQAELRIQRTGAGLRVVQTLRVQNRGTHTFHVATANRKSGTPALQTRLPEGAIDFQMPLGLIPEGVERKGRELRWWGPVHPGTQEISFSFEFPASGTPETASTGEHLEIPWELPAGASGLRLWIPDGAELETPELSPVELAPGESPGFLAYDGGPVAPGTRLMVSLRVPTARLVAGEVRPIEVRAVLAVDDAAMSVSETHVLEITGEARLLGTAEAPLYFIPLPAGIAQLRFGSDGRGITLLPGSGGGMAVTGEAEPGELRVEIAYQVQVDDYPVAFERSWPVPVPLLSIFLVDPGNLAPYSDRLHRRRPVRTSDQTYMHLEAFEVVPGETVSLSIDRRPPKKHLPAFAFRGGLAIGGALVLALLVAPLWRGRFSGGGLGVDSETAASRERDAVIAALRDLDHDFETGKVENEDYGTLRDELRARAIELMREERGQATDPSDTSAPLAACSQCGAVREAEHRFCAQCGAAQGGGDG